jgi:branched-chain amino acid transport system ATP-binding protein
VLSEPLLELQGVTVHYRSLRALDRVTYRVGTGAIVCLLGGNASGKSTTMKAIFGTVPLTSGEVRWQGQIINRLSTVNRVALGLSAVPEGRRVFFRMSVEENLLIGAHKRRDHVDILSDLSNLYDLFPRLRERRTQLAGTLSGGEQQMVAVARALMSRPQLVCMDEPSMGLSPALVRQTFSLIQTIRDRGTAVFLVEQNANAALRIADYAYVLQSGTLVLEGPAAKVANDPTMREAYLGHGVRASAPPVREPGNERPPNSPPQEQDDQDAGET